MMTLAVLAQDAVVGAESARYLALGAGGLLVVLIAGALVASFGNERADDPPDEAAEEPRPPIPSTRA